VPIQGEDELDLAIEVLDRLTAKKSLNKGERMYVDTLTLLIEAYEDVHHPIGPASDKDILRHLMDARGVKQIELHRDTSIAKSTISEVLAGRRAFSKSMIRKLADYFGVDVSILAANL
jgi:HTH-type transcriptional regulator/antitoxin HigA